MTFRTALYNHIRRRRLARRMATLKTARQKLMSAAIHADEQRATVLTNLAAYVDIVLSYLWPVWRKG